MRHGYARLTAQVRLCITTRLACGDSLRGIGQASRWWVLLLLLCGCAEEVPRPPAAPLAAAQAELGQLYKWGAGPWAVRAARGLRIARQESGDALRFHVHYPTVATASPEASAEAVPVLLFSHGNWSNNDKYDNLIRHWVSHGYAVLAPLHRDADGGVLSSMIDLFRYGRLAVIQARVNDLMALLDALPRLEAQLPDLAGPLDLERIAATGHSFGAFNAQQLGGASAFDAEAQNWVAVADQRIKAVVAISPPGIMPEEIAEGSWQGMDAPSLMTTGTWDAAAPFWPDWRMHKLSFETAVPGHQYALVVQGADHYLGNLICRPERDGPPQRDALAMVNTAVVAFLDAYLKQSAAALAFLQSPEFEEITKSFAVLEHR